MRQAPKVILVGEMRDRATVEVALMASETGHLVLSTLHTVDAGQTINRILGMFSQGEEQQLRMRLADTLRYIMSQRLAPQGMAEDGRLLPKSWATICVPRKRLLLAKASTASFYEIIEASETFGWMTFDQSILNAYEADLITDETAKLYATKRGRVTRAIDLIQKMRGLETDLESGLRLDIPTNVFH